MSENKERFHEAESRGKACFDNAEAKKRSDEIQLYLNFDEYIRQGEPAQKEEAGYMKRRDRLVIAELRTRK